MTPQERVVREAKAESLEEAAAYWRHQATSRPDLNGKTELPFEALVAWLMAEAASVRRGEK